MHHPTLYAAVVGLLATLPGAQAGLYPKSSPVLQLDSKNFEAILNSRRTSIVEFYAPWCGHCQNLKPAYEKAARNLEGLANVAAVNCDEDANKPLCGQYGVQGFPTLKIFKPPKSGRGRAIPNDYNGQRSATEIVNAVVSNINNHVTKIEDKNIEEFLSTKNESAKAILFTEKGTTSALMKAIAIDFLDVIAFGQARNTQKKTIEKFGITSFPTLLLLPGGEAEGIVYDGETKKKDMVAFLSQAGQPNEEPQPQVKKQSKPKSSAKAKTTAPASTEAGDRSTQEQHVIVDDALPLVAIHTSEKLHKLCLNEKSQTCILAFVPSVQDEKTKTALRTLADVAHKHSHSKRHLFPFYEVPKSNEGGKAVLEALGLSGDLVAPQIIAVNARRGWWRQFEGTDYDQEHIGTWIDAIRMSEGAKKKLPEGIVVPAVAQEVAESQAEGEAVKESSSSTKGADPVVEAETAVEHEEL